MRIAIVTTGTTGDVLPYVALAVGCWRPAGHEVWLCSADKYAAETKARGLPFVPCWPWNDERHRELVEALLAAKTAPRLHARPRRSVRSPSLVELAGVELRDRGEEARIAVERNHSRNESTARPQSGTRPAIARSF